MRLSTTLALGAILVAPPLHAQKADTVPGARPGWSVERAMRAFTRNFDYHAQDYFPRRGTWDYVSRTRDHTGAVHHGILRIPTAQTDSAMNGPLCGQFQHADEVRLYSLVYYAVERTSPWRRVSATRFVPRHADREATVFVDWRQEDGRWVIARVGSRSDYIPSEPAPATPRDTLAGRYPRFPLPADGRYAGEMDWYRNDEAIITGGHRRTKYGQPRQLSERDVVYYTSYQGVAVYAVPSEIGRWRSPEIVYVPVDRTGSFQPYMGYSAC